MNEDESADDLDESAARAGRWWPKGGVGGQESGAELTGSEVIQEVGAGVTNLRTLADTVPPVRDATSAKLRNRFSLA